MASYGESARKLHANGNMMILAISGQQSYNIRTRFLKHSDKNLETYGQNSYNIRTKH